MAARENTLQSLPAERPRKDAGKLIVSYLAGSGANGASGAYLPIRKRPEEG